MEYGIGRYILDKNALYQMHSVFMISLFSLSILCLFCLLPSSRLCLYLSEENKDKDMEYGIGRYVYIR